MRRLLPLLFGLMLAPVPCFLWADSGPSVSSTSDIPFDEVDPAALQMHITQQIASFLQRLDGHWGESPEDILKRVAGTPERADRGALVFTRTLADHGVVEGYEFREGSLVRGRYVFLQRPVNGLNEFIDYYAAIKDSLIASYGRPDHDETIWSNDLYQPLPDYWGIAVQIGHLRYAASWRTAQGTLHIELAGNHHCRLMIDYRSHTFADHSQTT